MTIEEILLPHLPKSFMLPKMWMWSPRKFSLSNATIWGMSPTGRIVSPAIAEGAKAVTVTNSSARQRRA